MAKPASFKTKAMLSEPAPQISPRKRPSRAASRKREAENPPCVATLPVASAMAADASAHFAQPHASMASASAGNAAEMAADCLAAREFILDALRDGLPDRAILAMLGERFNLSLAGRLEALDTAYKYAVSFFMERRAATEHAAKSLLLRDELMRKAIADGDYRIALSALDSRDKLLGLANREGLVPDSGARSLMELAELASQFRQGQKA